MKCWQLGGRLGCLVAIALSFACGTPSAPAEGKFDTSVLLEKLESRDGPLVVNFWATWCPPCVAELPALQELADELAPRGIAVQTVSIDLAMPMDEVSTAEELDAYVAKNDMKLPVWAFDGDLQVLSDKLELPGPIPYTMVFDATGKARATHLGQASLAEFRKLVEEALGPQ